jgi:hypothetical protein
MHVRTLTPAQGKLIGRPPEFEKPLADGSQVLAASLSSPSTFLFPTSAFSYSCSRCACQA